MSRKLRERRGDGVEGETDRGKDNFCVWTIKRAAHPHSLYFLFACVCVYACVCVEGRGLLLSCVWQILKIIVRFLHLACVIPLLLQLKQHSPGLRRRREKQTWTGGAECGGWCVEQKEDYCTLVCAVSEICESGWIQGLGLPAQNAGFMHISVALEGSVRLCGLSWWFLWRMAWGKVLVSLLLKQVCHWSE